MRILIAEDQRMMQESIKAFLKQIPGIEIVGFAENGQMAIEQTEKLHPDIILVDLFMPVMDGLTATTIISQRFKSTRVLIVTGQEVEQNRYLAEALIAGAKGYLLKKNLSENLIHAIQAIQEGNLYLFPSREKIDDFLSIHETENFELASLSYWLAREVIFQWCKQPIGKTTSVADIMEELGVGYGQNKSKIINLLEKYPENNTTLSLELLSKIEKLQTQQDIDRPKYAKEALQQVAITIDSWFQTSSSYPSMFEHKLQANVKYLRFQSLNKISKILTELWQISGTETLLNFLQELESSLQSTAEKYDRIRQNYLFKMNSAWRAYKTLTEKLDSEKDSKAENWQAAWNALKLTYQFKIEEKIYYFASELVNQFAFQVRMYCQALIATNKLLDSLQNWFSQQSSLHPALLPCLLVHLEKEVDFYDIRNQIEVQTGHFLNQWGTSSSISEELLKEKLMMLVKPIGMQLYINSCRQALSFSSSLKSLNESSE